MPLKWEINLVNVLLDNRNIILKFKKSFNTSGSHFGKYYLIAYQKLSYW